MKSILFNLLATSIFMLPYFSYAQKIKTGNTAFFKMDEQQFSKLDGPIPRGIYKFKVPLYIAGYVTTQDTRYGHADLKAQYFLYTCSDTSDTWIQTTKITVEKYSYTGELVATEIWDLSKENLYRKKAYYLRPLTGEAIKVLTRDKVVYKTDSCPRIKAQNKVAPPKR
ncbi:hypothetical protein [Aureispira sp. CCB-QB1]|uniref:hypothetical protein n=1 Tax=Aureispira sp. CCB-QB1 TaxID=1313421 RepID=UPI0012DDEB21|nr:hypothetical protein [Aureispira sp. CCB-QB1]